MALTPKQERFCQEYLIDLNATQAAKRAGYSERTAQEQSSRLLSNAMVQTRIQELQQSRSERTQITADNVLREIALLAFSDLGAVLDFDGDEVRLKPAKEISKGARRTLSAMKVKRVWEGSSDNRVPVDVIEFKLWSKTEALRDLGRHLKLFTDNVNVNLPDIDAAIRGELARLAGPSQAQDAGTPSADTDTNAGDDASAADGGSVTGAD